MSIRRARVLLREFWRDPRGTIAAIFAIVLSVTLLAVGGSMDMMQATILKSRLQAEIDAAALAGARTLSLSDANRDSVAATVDAMISASYRDRDLKPSSVRTLVNTDPALEVQVGATQTAKPFFGSQLGFNEIVLNVTAVARILGKPNICLLALDPVQKGTLAVGSDSFVVGNDCALFSNSKSRQGISVKDGASVTAKATCSAGGIDENGSIAPEPYQDCPQFEDPLASRIAPASNTCDYTKLALKNVTQSISPGVYCGGLKLAGNAVITAQPGVYIIKGGDFEVKDHAQLKGSNVSFFLESDSALNLDEHTSIVLEASKAGPLAGLLFFGSREQPQQMKHQILSQDAQMLLGTVYFPNATLVVGSQYGPGRAKLGGAAAYTAIVARKVIVQNKSTVTLNSNFEQTDVPVPEGIRGVAQPVSLVK